MEAVTQNIYRLTTLYKDIYTTVTIVKTPLGAVLFDTASYREDVEDTILPALKELGIDGSVLKYIVISHAHGDHAGGLQWVAEAYPDVCILSRSPDLKERFGSAVRCPEDGEVILDTLRIIAVPGHSADSLCLLDTVTGTLISGDSLQLYGIYGSGAWGANVGLPVEHLEAIDKLRRLDIRRIVASHDYHPFGYLAEGRNAVRKYLDACPEALYRILDAIRSHPDMDSESLAAMYNGQSGLPTVNKRIFENLREASVLGRI